MSQNTTDGIHLSEVDTYFSEIAGATGQADAAGGVRSETSDFGEIADN